MTATDTRLPVVSADAFARRFEEPLHAVGITAVQINIGLRCNLACAHCHVDSSPQRRGDEDNMSEETADRILAWILDHPQIDTVDLTGGSPEMNPNFRRMVVAFKRRGMRVIDRFNPTIYGHVDRDGTDYKWIPGFLAEHRVEVSASLPCYTADNVNEQRGRGAFDASIEGLLALNAVGYGRDPELELNLVYNPVGPSLPPPQASLEQDYKRELRERFGIEFTRLWTITNMPIKRFRRQLERNSKLEPYMDKLVHAFNRDTLGELMCQHQIHVDSQGNLSDCDFNFALGMPTSLGRGTKLWDLTAENLDDRRVVTADHCYGCTAGSGSSCTGSLT
ncbi:arsenosugar biosynthesis radical SAM (seleno)protein ArsS [Phycisphaera mikurensis]|uniref:Radical SAM core domain-containing protein n=1 Tax=Phycisphaera mikurensis (strain NBRC 102666 / KCTC 22515 / FYK2301M01) TaxID=1142394 RepID=I0IF25_PHYMF|nr:arsenosugar biosynthesis radical SAM (seleno)protein ArsS [Phycisphaera mikurensis]MBB6441654.1 radical SAM/Cys-rich protein [Phycisphaera mikurensis]BAM03863.1 hypothetical protein PSMK_17040 [Phycisphaera mikurensis NBRC 102666]